MRDRIFYSICFGFIFGVLLRSFFFINFYFIILLDAISFALFLFFSFISKNKWGIIISIFLIALSLGMLRFNVYDKSEPEFFKSQINKEASFIGIVVDEPDLRE